MRYMILNLINGFITMISLINFWIANQRLSILKHCGIVPWNKLIIIQFVDWIIYYTLRLRTVAYLGNSDQLNMSYWRAFGDLTRSITQLNFLTRMSIHDTYSRNLFHNFITNAALLHGITWLPNFCGIGDLSWNNHVFW